MIELPNIKELVGNNNIVLFKYYQKNELWYGVYESRLHIDVENTLFDFPVPTEDCGDGVFLNKDRAMMFMRYIRKHLDYLKESQV